MLDKWDQECKINVQMINDNFMLTKLEILKKSLKKITNY